MSIRILGLCATLSMAAGMSQASTFTLNDMTATCVSGTCTQFNSTVVSALGPNAVYGLSDPSFVDGAGNTYAARVTVVDTGGPAGSNHSSVNVSPLNAWIHYAFEFVESFDADAKTFGAATTVEGVRFVNIEDIDSNFGSNFTDVAAVNLAVAGLGSALELGGFGAATLDQPVVGPEFNFVRLDDGANGTWADEVNVPSKANLADKQSVTASFDAGGDLAGFEFIWGSTGGGNGNVRGWDVTITAEPSAPPPVPLPASLPLLLAGLGGIAALRRARRTA